MSKSYTYDECDMPHVSDAYDTLEEMVLDEHIEIEAALVIVTNTYKLKYNDVQRIYAWLQDEIATLEGDADGQDRLDEDH